MKRFLILTGIAVVVLICMVYLFNYNNNTWFDFMKQTKVYSPEDTALFTQKGTTVHVIYNRPYKKNRDIFGKLVPYNEVWRTGANEATTLETNHDLLIKDKRLKKGKYSLWTIPKEDHWTIIFNSQYGQWGINSEGLANRNPKDDVLTITIPAIQQNREFEQFTIAFQPGDGEHEMILMWDKTIVSIPFKIVQ